MLMFREGTKMRFLVFCEGHRVGAAFMDDLIRGIDFVGFDDGYQMLSAALSDTDSAFFCGWIIQEFD